VTLRPLLALASVSLVIAVLGVRACGGPEERLAFKFYDDAYYYLGVAKSLGAGEGSTFDGLHRTNGYHPLWCAMLVPALAVFDDPGSGLRAAAALWFALAAAVPWAVFWATRRRLGDLGAATAAVLFSTLPWLGLSLARPNGLETPLLALVICAVVGTAERDLETPSSSAFVGALAGLATLARLDAGLLAVAIVIATARRSLRRAGLVAAGAALVAGPYLLWNTVSFGHPLPVSGRVLALEAEKAREAHGGTLSIGNAVARARIAAVDIPKDIAERALHGLPIRPFAALVVLALIAIGLWRRPGLAVLGLFAALHYAAYALWLWTPGEEAYRVYYFLPEVLVGCVLAAAGIEALIERARPAKSSRAAFGIVGTVILSAHAIAQANIYAKDLPAQPGPVSSRHIYGWVREHLPAGALLGARDAGKLGWFSGHRVVNLDGLINDAAFLKALRTDTVDAYICASPIRYLLYDRPYVATKLTEAGPCRIRSAGTATDDWVVLEVVRDP
jgi:hypothetical protein